MEKKFIAGPGDKLDDALVGGIKPRMDANDSAAGSALLRNRKSKIGNRKSRIADLRLPIAD
jgi:hypothetical protein